VLSSLLQKGGDSVAKKKDDQDLRVTNIRGIPGVHYKVLKIEAARQEISLNQLVVNILTKEAKRLEKKGG
jgi:predicted HicB family RNase H-like nuclease